MARAIVIGPTRKTAELLLSEQIPLTPPIKRLPPLDRLAARFDSAAFLDAAAQASDPRVDFALLGFNPMLPSSVSASLTRT